MRRFEYAEGASNKFWEIEVLDCDVTTTWGRIGTAGQSKTKTFPSAAQAQAESDKLVRAKVKEGYHEAGGPAGPSVPDTRCPLLIRTDFSNPEAWSEICSLLNTHGAELAAAPSAGSRNPDFGHIDYLDDPQWDGKGKDQILWLLPGGYKKTFEYVLVADGLSMTDPEHRLLLVNLQRLESEPSIPRGKGFRIIPLAVYGVAVNVSLANMDLVEFAEGVEEDGTYREVLEYA